MIRTPSAIYYYYTLLGKKSVNVVILGKPAMMYFLEDHFKAIKFGNLYDNFSPSIEPRALQTLGRVGCALDKRR
jgi:hypothetical protein